MTVTRLLTDAQESRIRPDGCVSSDELVAIAGISYRQCDHWTRLGYLHPVGPAEPGSGSRRWYERSEAHVAAIAKALMDDMAIGQALGKTLDIARELYERGEPVRLGRFTLTPTWEDQ